MDVRFIPPDLRRLDTLKSEALSIPFFEDERPLQGALGLVDWRLSGGLSRLLVGGRISGARGERVLVPARPKLPFEKLFLFGLGSRESFDDQAFDEATGDIFRTWNRARVRASVCVLPGRALELIPAERAMERFLAVAAECAEQDEVTLIEDAEAQKAMAPIAVGEKRRLRARS